MDEGFLQRVGPTHPGESLASWLELHQDRWPKRLLEHGALLFRGFSTTPEQFAGLSGALFREQLPYLFRSTPRTEVGARVYTATEYPAPLTISQHSENAYQRDWPMKLAFYCQIPPAEGGETPLTDNRETTALLPASIRARFEEKQVMYVRNFGHGIDLPWTVVFQTTDRREVERYCEANGIQYEWLGGERLRTRQVLPALARHPVTGESFWFNQAHLFHVSDLDPNTRKAMLGLFKKEDLPRLAFYGDGSELEEEVLEQIRAAYRNPTVFRWEEGDVLLLDNMRVAHGRKPYRGPRRVLTMLGESYRSTLEARATG